MKTARNSKHTSTTSEFVKACKRFRQEFGFACGLVPDDDPASSLHPFGSTGPLERIANHHDSSINCRSTPVPDRSNVILIQVRPCLASFVH